MLIASCVATPSFAADTDTTKAEGAKTEAASDCKCDDAKATNTSATPDTAKEPQEPTAEDAKKIGTDRGIIITEINSPSKAKATTADIKGKQTPTIKRVSTAGEQSFNRGLVIDTTKIKEKPHQNQSSLLIKPTTKPVTQTKTAHTSPIVIQKSSTTPLKVKTQPPVTQTAKVNPTTKANPTSKVNPTPKHQEAIANKTHHNVNVVAPSNSGEQIVTAWLNKSGSKPHYSNGEKLQINVAANKDCNLMIFNYDGEQLTQLYPNEYQASPLVKAGQTVEVGGEGFKFDFTASNSSSKASNEKIFVYAYPIESDNSPISVAMAKIPSSPFRAVEMTPEQYRDLVNKAQVFSGRKVSVSAKKSADVEEVQLASYSEQSQAQGGAANKIELSLVIDGIKKN
jgi:hypothetical protein